MSRNYLPSSIQLEVILYKIVQANSIRTIHVHILPCKVGVPMSVTYCDWTPCN